MADAMEPSDLILEDAEPGRLEARLGDRVVGTVGWRVVDGSTAELVGPEVAEEYADGALPGELVRAVEEVAAEEGFRRLATAAGVRPLPVLFDVQTAEAMQALGSRLAELFRPGDLVIAAGELGAGKTTLTQGIGAGLGVLGPVTSPTFVLARVHRGGVGRPDLVHVDAYRLGSLDEIDDLDLDSDVDHSVTVVEWGAGVAEQLSADRLEIEIRRAVGAGPAADARTVVVRPVGERWADVDFDWAGELA